MLVYAIRRLSDSEIQSAKLNKNTDYSKNYKGFTKSFKNENESQELVNNLKQRLTIDDDESMQELSNSSHRKF